MSHAKFEDVVEIVSGRCSMCHAAEPVWEGIRVAPKGLILETEAQIAKYAHEIYLHAGRTRAMPPGNITELEDSDRALLAKWYQETMRGKGSS